MTLRDQHRGSNAGNVLVCSTNKHAIWSRFASSRAEVKLIPSQSRANLFAGD